MNLRRLAIAVVVLLMASQLAASGLIGIYGVVEKVVFEPDEKSPERIQVWGAFAYVDGPGTGVTTSAVKRGYLYFGLPESTSDSVADTIKKEWADLKSVAGTDQAIGFGRWGYIASFNSLQPDARPVPPSVILQNVPHGGVDTDLRVRPASEAPASPATYQTNTGVVRLSDQGNHAAIVKALRDALKR